MLAGVKEREVVGIGIVADGEAQAVVHGVHQMALLDGQDLVEGTVGMVTHRALLHGLAQRFRVSSLQPPTLLLREPAAVGKAVLQLVAVLLRLGRAQDGRARRQLHLADAREGIHHLLLLCLQLQLVGQHLPFAASADAEMGTEGRDAVGRRLHESHDLALGIAVFLFRNLDIHHISGDGKGHEDHQVLDSHQRLTLGGDSLYGHALQKRQRFTFSAHNLIAQILLSLIVRAKVRTILHFSRKVLRISFGSAQKKSYFCALEIQKLHIIHLLITLTNESKTCLHLRQRTS